MGVGRVLKSLGNGDDARNFRHSFVVFAGLAFAKRTNLSLTINCIHHRKLYIHHNIWVGSIIHPLLWFFLLGL